jgi:hypothetical protein
VENGTYRAADRTGRSLVSAGDLQITLTAVKMGYWLGIFPQLKINHLIAERKATMSYFKKHAYGVASSYDQAVLDVFPELKTDVERITPTKWVAFKSIAKFCLTNNPLSRQYLIDLSEHLGHLVSKFTVLEIPVPGWIHFLVKRIKAV